MVQEREFRALRDLPELPVQLPDLPEILGISTSTSSASQADKLTWQQDSHPQSDFRPQPEFLQRKDGPATGVRATLRNSRMPLLLASDSFSNANLLRATLCLSSNDEEVIVDSGQSYEGRSVRKSCGKLVRLKLLMLPR
jgi:hypothetical protein